MAAAGEFRPRVRIGAGDFPGDLVAACRLLGADQRPGASTGCRKFTHDNRRAVILQLDRKSVVEGKSVELGGRRIITRKNERLNNGGPKNADHTATTQLM